MAQLFKRKWKDADGNVRETPIWWIRYYQNGVKVQESTGTEDEKKALKVLKLREADVIKGVHIDPKAGKITWPEGFKAVEHDYSTNGRDTLAEVKRRNRMHLAPFFGQRRMVQIDTSLIRAYAKARLDAGASNATVNRELAIIKRAFTLAVQAGKLTAKPHVPMLKESNARKGFFERDQFEAVRDHLPEDVRGVASFAYITGWRTRSEILPLEWRNVDFDAREVRLDPGTTKNGEGRTFPFTAELETLLKAQHVEHERLKQAGKIVPWVFHRDGKRIHSFRGSWLTACRNAGVPGRLLHDLRRTAVRNLERSGVPRSAAMAMVGHKTESIYRRYAIVDSATLREAAAKIDQHLMGTKSETGTKKERTA